MVKKAEEEEEDELLRPRGAREVPACVCVWHQLNLDLTHLCLLVIVSCLASFDHLGPKRVHDGACVLPISIDF